MLTASGFAKRANAAKEAFGARGSPIPSQEWLAQRASSFLEEEQITQTVVSRWLKGTHVPESPLRAWAFAQALMVDAGWLLFGEASGAPAPELDLPVMRVAESDYSTARVTNRGAGPIPEPEPEIARTPARRKRGAR